MSKNQTRYMTVCGMIKALEELRAAGHGNKYVVQNGQQQAGPSEILAIDIETRDIPNPKGGWGSTESRQVVELWTSWGMD